MIIRRNGRTTLEPSVDLNDLQVYIFSAYVFVLPFNGMYTYKQFADQIKKVFDLSNKTNEVVYNEVLKMEELDAKLSNVQEV